MLNMRVDSIEVLACYSGLLPAVALSRPSIVSWETEEKKTTFWVEVAPYEATLIVLSAKGCNKVFMAGYTQPARLNSVQVWEYVLCRQYIGL